MRRFLGILLLASSLMLVAVVPTPTPTPIALPTPDVQNEPTVILFPFDQSGDMQPNTGLAVAQIFAQAFASSPGVRVLEIAKGVPRGSYQAYAHSKKSDYYVSGYMTPIGNGAAVVEQLVSTESGIIIYSQTSQIYSVQDVASLALGIHDAIVAIASPPNQNVGPAQQATPAPASSNGGQLSLSGLSGIVNSIFGHPAKKSGPTTARATAPPKPSRIAIVVRVSGTASAGALTDATNDLAARLAYFFTTATPRIAVNNISAQSNTLCGTNRDQSIVTGTLTQSRTGGFRPRTSSTFTLDVYACFGAKLFTTTTTNDDLRAAVIEAVDAYQNSHPANN